MQTFLEQPNAMSWSSTAEPASSQHAGHADEKKMEEPKEQPASSQNAGHASSHGEPPPKESPALTDPNTSSDEDTFVQMLGTGPLGDKKGASRDWENEEYPAWCFTPQF